MTNREGVLLGNKYYACLCMLLFILCMNICSADSRKVIEYQYDGAGNIISILSDVSTAPPVIQLLSPSEIHIGQTLRMTATGTNVKNAQVSVDHPGLDASNLSSTSSSVEFDFLVDSNVPLGTQILTFTTSLGSDTSTITILPPLLALLVTPSPIAVNNLGDAVPITITLPVAELVDQTLSLAISDTSLATVSPATVIIPAGQTQPAEAVSIIITGSTLGVTSLTITSSVTLDYETPVYITEPYAPPVGDNNVFSKPLGIFLTPGGSEQGTTTHLITAPLLGIEKEISATNNTTDLLITSPLLGIEKSLSTPAGNDNETLLAAPMLGVALGANIFQVSPGLIPGNTTTLLTVEGHALDAVTDVIIEPNDGITQTGTLGAAADGMQVSVTLNVAETAPLTTRLVRLMAGAEEVPFAGSANAKIKIMGDLPIIYSLNPEQEPRGTSFILTVNGINLTDASSVNVTPFTDLTIGAPTVNLEGTQLTVEIIIDANATLGTRAITITTPAGTGSANASPDNTFNITN